MWNRWRVHQSLVTSCSGFPALVFPPALGGSSLLPMEAGMWETDERRRAWLFHLVHHCHRLCPDLSHGGLALQHKDELSAPQNKTLPLRRVNKTWQGLPPSFCYEEARRSSRSCIQFQKTSVNDSIRREESQAEIPLFHLGTLVTDKEAVGIHGDLQKDSKQLGHLTGPHGLI